LRIGAEFHQLRRLADKGREAKMKFGAFLWQRRGEDLAANARLAEELSFDSLWMGEHLGFPVEFKSPATR